MEFSDPWKILIQIDLEPRVTHEKIYRYGLILTFDVFTCRLRKAILVRFRVRSEDSHDSQHFHFANNSFTRARTLLVTVGACWVGEGGELLRKYKRVKWRSSRGFHGALYPSRLYLHNGTLKLKFAIKDDSWRRQKATQAACDWRGIRDVAPHQIIIEGLANIRESYSPEISLETTQKMN